MNSVLLLGRVLGSPSVVWTDRGTQQASCRVLVTETGPHGEAFKTFVPCVPYGKAAEKLTELDADAVVVISGKLTWRKASDDGKKPGRLEVFIREVEPDRQAVAPTVGGEH